METIEYIYLVKFKDIKKERTIITQQENPNFDSDKVEWVKLIGKVFRKE